VKTHPQLAVDTISIISHFSVTEGWLSQLATAIGASLMQDMTLTQQALRM
jgi:hypothetical protein